MGKLVDATAQCSDCEFEAHSLNAVGLGAQHAKRYGHTVLAENSFGYVFKGDGE